MILPSNLPPGCSNEDIEEQAGMRRPARFWPSVRDHHHINALAASIAPAVIWDIARREMWSTKEVASQCVALAIEIYCQSAREIGITDEVDAD